MHFSWLPLIWHVNNINTGKRQDHSQLKNLQNNKKKQIMLTILSELNVNFFI